MANTMVSLDVHLIFRIKSSCRPFDVLDLPRIFAYIGGIIRNIGAIAYEIGGMPDHIHILASLPKDRSLADFVRTIKTNSSRWIKTLGGSNSRFSWQSGYGAFSVSVSLKERTREYIKNQHVHHKGCSFKEEYIKILEMHGLKYDERFVFGD